MPEPEELLAVLKKPAYRHFEAERLAGPETDDRLILGRLLVLADPPGFSPLQYAVNVTGRTVGTA
jgi:hypothetical protein